MILAAFHLAARRDRSTHQKQEPSDGYVSISCDVAKCRQSATGPIADVRVLQVKQVQQVNANGQFVLFSIPAILTIEVVVGRFELPLIDGAQAKFKSD